MEYLKNTAGWEDQVREVWRECFPEDSERYLDWVMEHKYRPEACRALVIDGRIAALTHILPLKLRVFQKTLELPFLYGVGTRKAFRHRGLATALMGEYLAEERENRRAFVGLYPFNHQFYRKLGYGVLEDCLLCRDPAAPGKASGAELTAPAMLEVFQAMTAGFDTAPVRDLARCQSRIDEWRCDGGAAADFGGAYALYAKDGETLFVEELACAQKEALGRAREALKAAAAAMGCAFVQYRLPLGLGYGEGRQEPHAMVRIVCLKEALQWARPQKGAKPARFCISDPLAPWNEGTVALTPEGDGFSVEQGGAGEALSIDRLADMLFFREGAGPFAPNNGCFFEHY